MEKINIFNTYLESDMDGISTTLRIDKTETIVVDGKHFPTEKEIEFFYKTDEYFYKNVDDFTGITDFVQTRVNL
jgi:hypothetical protein